LKAIPKIAEMKPATHMGEGKSYTISPKKT